MVLHRLNAQQDRCEQELNNSLEEYEALSTHTANFNQNALWQERLKLRDDMFKEIAELLHSCFGSDFSTRRFQSAEADVRLYLGDNKCGLQWCADRKRDAEQMNMQQKPIKRETDEYRRYHGLRDIACDLAIMVVPAIWRCMTQSNSDSYDFMS